MVAKRLARSSSTLRLGCNGNERGAAHVGARRDARAGLAAASLDTTIREEANLRTMFSGKGSEHDEWKVKLMAHLRRIVDKRIGEWMDWAQTQKDDITDVGGGSGGP